MKGLAPLALIVCFIVLSASAPIVEPLAAALTVVVLMSAVACVRRDSPPLVYPNGFSIYGVLIVLYSDAFMREKRLDLPATVKFPMIALSSRFLEPPMIPYGSPPT